MIGGLLKAEVMDLRRRIEALRPELAAAAQKVLDEWVQDEDGWDEELGSGGACDEISKAMTEVLYSLDGVEVADGGQDGDDHAFPVVYDDDEAYAVDIPPRVYETGGGYSWKKIEGALVREEDVSIVELDRDIVATW